jgi:hypothetical protein
MCAQVALGHPCSTKRGCSHPGEAEERRPTPDHDQKATKDTYKILLIQRPRSGRVNFEKEKNE